MKKILIATNVLLLGTVFFMACNSDKPIDRTKLPGVMIMKEPGAPQGIIDDDLAKVMSQNYSNDPGKAKVNPGDTLNKDDTRSVWFSLETLKSFISSIEESVETKECNLALGVRIYYGKYPHVLDNNRYPALEGLKPAVADRHTVFMVPTYLDPAKKGNIDFNFFSVGSDKCKPTPYWKLIGTGVKPSILGIDKSQYMYNGTGGIIYGLLEGDDGIQNHGGMAPPPAGTGTFPTPSSGF